jgi:hypothetical protein
VSDIGANHWAGLIEVGILKTSKKQYYQIRYAESKNDIGVHPYNWNNCL